MAPRSDQGLNRRFPRTPLRTKPRRRTTFLLMDQFERLEEWCRLLRTVFDGQPPYLVGSSSECPDFRDVDLRMILADDDFDAAWSDVVKVRLMNRAMSIWGQHETGLPIDFQIQRRTEANAEFGGRRRNPMGIRDWAHLATSGVPDPRELHQ